MINETETKPAASSQEQLVAELHRKLGSYELDIGQLSVDEKLAILELPPAVEQKLAISGESSNISKEDAAKWAEIGRWGCIRILERHPDDPKNSTPRFTPEQKNRVEKVLFKIIGDADEKSLVRLEAMDKLGQYCIEMTDKQEEIMHSALDDIVKNEKDRDIRGFAKIAMIRRIYVELGKPCPPILTRVLAAGIVIASAIGILSAFAPKSANAQVGGYPNFTDAGTHGNPAVFTQYGSWALVGASADRKGVNGMSAQVNMDFRGVQINAVAGTNGTKKTQMLNAGMQIGENFAAGVTIKPDGNASFGMLGIARQDSGKTLERGSFESDIKTHGSAAAVEVRRMIRDKVEATVSGKMEADSSGNVVFRGVGAQVKKESVLLSAGVGGKDDWKTIKLHARKWFGKKAFVDLQVQAKDGNFKKPAISVGLVKMLN